MPLPSDKRPTPVELEVLRVFWSLGRARVASVHKEMERVRPISITSVSTMIGVMVDKGFLRVVLDLRPREYEAAIVEDDLQRSIAGDLRDRIFNGSLRDLVMHAFRGRKPSAAEIAELKKLLDESN